MILNNIRTHIPVSISKKSPVHSPVRPFTMKLASFRLSLPLLLVFPVLFLVSCMEESTELSTDFNEVMVTKQDPALPSKPGNDLMVTALSVLSPGTDSTDFPSGCYATYKDPALIPIHTLYTPGVFSLYYTRETQIPGSALSRMEQISFTLRNIAVGTITLPSSNFIPSFGVFNRNRAFIQAYTYTTVYQGSMTILEYNESLRYIKGSFELKCRGIIPGETQPRQYHLKSNVFKAFF